MLTIWSFYLVAGLFAGFLSGLLGVGGGIVLVPTLVFVFTRQHFPDTHLFVAAVATSFANILFTSASSVMAHHRRGSVDWSVVRGMAPAVVTSTLIGTVFASRAPTRLLEGIFVLFMFYVGTRMLAGQKRAAGGVRPGRAGLAAAGFGIGGFSSLVGIGGGSLSVPFLSRCGLAFQNAIGTSAAIGFPIAAAGVAGYVANGLGAAGLPAWSAGFVYLPALAGLTAAGILTAPLGARMAHRLPVAALRRIFAVMLLATAVKMSLGLF